MSLLPDNLVPARSPPWLRSRASWLCLAALLTLLALPDAVWAAPFPRGPGFYFHPFKLILFMAAYAAWVATCNWVNRDVEKLSLETCKWNYLILGTGVMSLALLWVFPYFYLSLLLSLLLCGGAAYWYVYFRNQLVDADAQVLTEKHFRELARFYLKWDLPSSDADEEEPEDRPAIKFLGRSIHGGEENDDNLGRAYQQSKGYRAAEEMVYQALKTRATDIHMEPTKEEMSVRFRVDGIMTTQEPLTRSVGDAVVNIFKVIANLDITEKRKPQDGGFSASVDGRQVEFRVATAGSVVGEKMVMRCLDNAQKILTLSQLGMRDKMRETVRSIVKQPHGLFLVCGPTGAGKSSTLYACLQEIDRYQQNVITIENPVEYRLDNCTQIEVNPKAGKTFASELRSILRQDPDVILIGEIRDQETAEIACQAAQTGHIVFSTLHSNDATMAIGRLMDLGVDPFMISTALSGVLAQRLVRLLCPDCKVRYKPNPELLRKANLPADKIKFFYRPPTDKEKGKPEGEDDEEEEETVKQCATCNGTGYFKRTGIFELLVITDKMKDMIKENPNVNAIKQEAVKNGMRYLYEDGLRTVIEGKTSLQELLRVSK